MPKKNELILFTKYPIPGKAKTRLIPALGCEMAADLHRQMTEKTVATARKLAQEEGVYIRVFYEGGSLDVMREWLGEMDFERQKNGDLGEKMHDAFVKGFSCRAQKIVIIGTDCPTLTVDILKEAFLKLKEYDLVIGPASDGGYYLIGLKKRNKYLFKGISWGSGRVLHQTKKKADEYGLNVATLETLCDIDRPNDLLTLA